MNKLSIKFFVWFGIMLISCVDYYEESITYGEFMIIILLCMIGNIIDNK